MKLMSAVMLVVLLSGCSNFFPDKFDNVEYEYLTLLSLTAQKAECDYVSMTSMETYAEFLVAYTQYRNNTGTKEIYVGINDLVQEMMERGKFSQGYCTLKTRNIHELTQRAREVFGKRK